MPAIAHRPFGRTPAVADARNDTARAYRAGRPDVEQGAVKLGDGIDRSPAAVSEDEVPSVLVVAITAIVFAGRGAAAQFPTGVCRRACIPAAAVACATLRHRPYRRCLRKLVRMCRNVGTSVCSAPSTTSTSASTLTEPTSTTTSTLAPLPPQAHIQTAFIVVMENHAWSAIRDNPAAPYINQAILPVASHAEQYFNPPGIHPSEPNYLWLVAGTNFGILDDASPATNHLGTTGHLVALLDGAGISWKAYEEDVPGDTCPLGNIGWYSVAHNPFVFFDDVSGHDTGSPSYCIDHVRPYSELADDLIADRIARYNFITPDICHDMHQSCTGTTDPITDGDTWLSTLVPAIIASPAWARGVALFIVWDESSVGDGPIGMIVLSRFAKGGGYANMVHYTHSSTLRTIEEIFGVAPLLGDVATATDLEDLFAVFP